MAQVAHAFRAHAKQTRNVNGGQNRLSTLLARKQGFLHRKDRHLRWLGVLSVNLFVARQYTVRPTHRSAKC